MIKLAVVGLGNYANSIINNIEKVSSSQDCELVAVAERQVAEHFEKIKELTTKGVKVYEDALEMFHDMQGKCDAVYLPVGIGLHCCLTLAAFKYGYHVHVEKPAAATIQEVDKMIKAAKKADKHCIVGFQSLYSKDILYVKKKLYNGKLGKLLGINCVASWPRGENYYNRNNWAGKIKLNGKWYLDGPSTNALSHQIANMLFLAEPDPGKMTRPVSVRSELYSAGPHESHNIVSMKISTKTGIDLFFHCDHASKKTYGPIIEIITENGKIVWEIFKGATVYYKNSTTEFMPWDKFSSQKIISVFINAIENNDDSGLRSSLINTKGVTAVFDIAHESSGKIHKIPEKFWDIYYNNEDSFVVLPELTELFKKATEKKVLISELAETKEWAVKTCEYKASDYKRFPERFTC